MHDPDLSSPPAPAPRPLARRYAVLLCGVALALLLASGLSEMAFGYRESRAEIAALQAAQADGAARELALYLDTIVRGVRDVAKLPWGQPGYGTAQRREEFYRLMQLEPAITDLQVVDRGGRERLYVSKRENDREDAGTPFDEPALLAVDGHAPLRYGRTFYRDGLAPFMRVAVFDGAGTVVATVDLRLLDELVARLHVGRGGRAYIVDADDVLIAHPQATEALRKRDLGSFATVRQARASDLAREGTHEIVDAVDLQGRPVIATAAAVEGPRWLVIVEQPRAEALRPALATLSRTVLLVALGAALALAAGIWFARRMAAPIVALRRATGRVARGDLGSPIDATTGDDEIAALAHDFNLMTERLQASYAQLEGKVAERTAELSAARDVLQSQSIELELLNDRLRGQVDDLALRREEAERANAAKTRFLATASHDLRQPMHSIGLLVGVLRDRLGDAGQRALAEKVEASVSTMESLFESLLDISKLDAGGVRPQVEAIDAGALFARLAQTWAPLAREKGLALRVRGAPPGHAPLLRSDPILLERSLGNLLSNAIRYTREGGVLLACRPCREGPVAGATCLLQVWDTGPGIEPAYRDAVFDEFFRIDDARGGAAQGLGLGLSIVQRSAQILGHPLRLRSRVGRGSVFELAVPAMPRHDLAALPTGLGTDTAAALAGCFVVVVENDTVNRESLAELLRQCGCHVLDAVSCEEVLQRSREHLRAPDLVVTDYQLDADGDGLDVVERLRAHHEDALPALLVTANTDGALVARAAALGVRVIHKPVGAARLLRAVCEAIVGATA